MTVATILSTIVPIIAFVVGHWHGKTSGSAMPAPPTEIGHGQLANYFLQLLSYVFSQLPAAPSVPAPKPGQSSAQAGSEAVILKLLSVLEQSIQQPQSIQQAQSPAKAA